MEETHFSRHCSDKNPRTTAICSNSRRPFDTTFAEACLKQLTICWSKSPSQTVTILKTVPNIDIQASIILLFNGTRWYKYCFSFALTWFHLEQEWEPFSNLWAEASVWSELNRHQVFFGFLVAFFCHSFCIVLQVTAYHWSEDSEKWMCRAELGKINRLQQTHATIRSITIQSRSNSITIYINRCIVLSQEWTLPGDWCQVLPPWHFEHLQSSAFLRNPPKKSRQYQKVSKIAKVFMSVLWKASNGSLLAPRRCSRPLEPEK